MNINFCFIDGISSENEPYFASLQDQESYFNSLNNTTIITSTFYPPYYRNVLKIDTADISLDSNYNYVWFEYNGKRYYYFLSNVRYISEDLLAITITMDTIQTYYFDIKVHSAIVRRKFIDRFEPSGLINRSYIRENVSSGVTGKHTITKMSELTDYDVPSGTSNGIVGWYVVAQSNNNNYPEQKYVAKLGNSMSPYYVQLIPVTSGAPKSLIKLYDDKDHKDNPVEANTYATISREGGLPVTKSMAYCPINIFYGDLYLDATGAIKARNGSGIECWSADDKSGAYIVSGKMSAGNFDTSALNDKHLISKTITLQFARNKSKGIAFDKKFVPAILDENYYRISYGNGREQTTYPLHLLKQFSLTMSYTYDWLGYQYFRIYASGTDDQERNKYNTSVACSPNVVDLIVSGADNYNAYNKWSMMGAIASTAIGIGASLLTANPLPALGSAAGFFRIMNKNTGAVSETKYANGTNPIGEDGRLRGYNPSRDYHRYEDASSVSEYIPPNKGITIPGNAFYSFGNIANAVTAKANAYSSPASVKSFSSNMQNTSLNNEFIRREDIEVSDIEACAQYYHRYGYLVNEYIQPTTTLFADMNTRYYYNYIELAECDIELSCLQFDYCINDIETRLISGIRLWNPIVNTASGGTSVTYDIGNYSYDNVERSALNG